MKPVKKPCYFCGEELPVFLKHDPRMVRPATHKVRLFTHGRTYNACAEHAERFEKVGITRT